MADEELKRGGLAVLFSHEQKRDVGGKQHGTGGELQLLERDELTEPFAEHAVPDLIVVLRADDETFGRDVAGGSAVPASAIA